MGPRWWEPAGLSQAIHRRCGVSAVTGVRLKADKNRVSSESSNTSESYDATRRIRLTDVPGWVGVEVSGRRALPVPPRRVPPSIEQAGDTVARAVPSRAGHSTGYRVCPPRVVASRPDAGAARTGQLEVTDAAGAATDAAELQRPSSETGRWWSRSWWRQDHGHRAPEWDVGSVPSGNHEHAAEVKPGGRHRHG